MQLRKCDKCGDIFRPTDHAVSECNIYVYDSCHSSWPNGRTLHYCPKCTKDVVKILGVEE